jgi:hypothetical protein
MAWLTVDDNQRIMQVIDRVISKRIEITIRVKGEKTPFTSKIIKINQGSISSETERRPELIIAELVPEQGNSLIRSVPEVAVEFSINHHLFRCTLECIGLSSTPPHVGFIMSFPESLEIEERRKEERITHETPEFFSAEFRLGKRAKNAKLYQLNVLNRSRHGLGLLVTRKDLDFIRIVNKGDRLDGMILLASWAMITVSGTVSHVTRIQEGEYKGCDLLGIDSRDVIEGCKPNIHIGR